MKPTYNKVYIPLTIIAIIVLILQKFGPLAGQLRLVGFTLFTILCAALVIENRRTKGKVFAAIVYFFFGFVMYKFS
ncbi:hypothetical protein [Bacillus infantis]|uniref:hypothetical protein n=1 Tax=Bacillus infantis TaxID=324767 RepID=UPI0020A1A84F|nr:hypothetical protein [Bacillus infantis]MCP1156810.1 hypothetical protein [Bacillus infantis]